MAQDAVAFFHGEVAAGEVASVRPSNYQDVRLMTCLDRASEFRWSLRQKGNRNLSIVSRKNGKCLAANSGHDQNVRVEDCRDSNRNQMWRLIDRGDGYWSIQNIAGNTCIGLNFGQTNNDTEIRVFNCDGNTGNNQAWEIATR